MTCPLVGTVLFPSFAFLLGRLCPQFLQYTFLYILILVLIKYTCYFHLMIYKSDLYPQQVLSPP